MHVTPNYRTLSLDCMGTHADHTNLVPLQVTKHHYNTDIRVNCSALCRYGQATLYHKLLKFPVSTAYQIRPKETTPIRCLCMQSNILKTLTLELIAVHYASATLYYSIDKLLKFPVSTG